MTLTVISNSSCTDVDDQRQMKQPRGTTSSQTCRCLFGSVDHADNAATLAELRASLDTLSADRWGFDFSSGRPLPGGRFEWTQVDSQSAGNDVRDRVVLHPVTSSGHVTASGELRQSSSPTIVTSSQSRRRRQRGAGFDDVIRKVVVCAPASRQHRIARCRRQMITGELILNTRLYAYAQQQQQQFAHS